MLQAVRHLGLLVLCLLLTASAKAQEASDVSALLQKYPGATEVMVYAFNTPIRKAPDEDAEIVMRVGAGDVLVAYEQEGKFYGVARPGDGPIGYVRAEWVQGDPPQPVARTPADRTKAAAGPEVPGKRPKPPASPPIQLPQTAPTMNLGADDNPPATSTARTAPSEGGSARTATEPKAGTPPEQKASASPESKADTAPEPSATARVDLAEALSAAARAEDDTAEEEQLLEGRAASASSFDAKSQVAATLLSVLVPGGGQFYAGETGKGVGLFVIAAAGPLIGYAVTARTMAVDCYDYNCSDETSYAPLYVGAALGVGAWLLGVFTAGDDARRYNEHHRLLPEDLSGEGLSVRPTMHRNAGASGYGMRLSYRF